MSQRVHQFHQRVAELARWYSSNPVGQPPQRSPLGRWINGQRTHRLTMPDERRASLESMTRWVWDGISARASEVWTAHLEALEDWYVAHPTGHPNSAADEDAERRLGEWVLNQRRLGTRLAPERRAALERLPRWEWKLRRRAARDGRSTTDRLARATAASSNGASTPQFSRQITGGDRR